MLIGGRVAGDVLTFCGCYSFHRRAHVGYRGYCTCHVPGDEDAQKEERVMLDLLDITQLSLQLLSLPQFQPILLPKYVVELLALLVYGEVAMDATTVTSSIQTSAGNDVAYAAAALKYEQPACSTRPGHSCSKRLRGRSTV